MLRTRFLVALAAMGAVVCSHDVSAEPPVGKGYKKDTVVRGSPARPLTPPGQGRAAERAKGFINAERGALGLTEHDVEELAVTGESASPAAGVRHVFVRQRVAGLEVVGADANLSVAEDGRVLVFGNGFFPNAAAHVNRTDAVLGAVDAINAAALHLGAEITEQLETLEAGRGVEQAAVFSGGGIATQPISARLVFQPVGAEDLRLAWELDIEQAGTRHLWRLAVDAETGEVIAQEDYTTANFWDPEHDHAHVGAHDFGTSQGAAGMASASGYEPPVIVTPSPVVDGSSYNVFALAKDSPVDGPRTIVTNPADATASPFGWHDTNGAPGAEFTITRGNNTRTGLDRAAPNGIDPGGEAEGGPSLTFDFPLDLSLEPETYGDAVVANLFYWCNISHDLFYLYGFDEPSGNFQVNNYGRGGAGNDAVQCEAQDYSGTNNANFSTPARDGTGTPRMQMYIWTPVAANFVTIEAPSPAAGTYSASGAGFGPPVETTPLDGPVTLANDGTALPFEGCSPFIGFPAGHIAMVYRGTCPFTQKVYNAQLAGAIGVIVGNNTPGNPAAMGGADARITIPSVMVSQSDAQIIEAGLPATANIRFNPDSVSRDSSLDAGIIIHEYAHGVSNRLTGGPNTNCLGGQEQMGEGWSDYYALAFLLNPDLDDPEGTRGMGPYVIYEPSRQGGGIRPRPYSRSMEIQPFTYDSIKSGAWLNGGELSQPHGIGHGWAAILWDMTWDLIDKYGFNPNVYGGWNTGGNNRAIQYVTDGMKFQGCNPGFVAGRNGILAAVEALAPEDVCTVWAAFARRGVGFSAVQGTTNRNDNSEAFDVPLQCRAGFQSPVQMPYGELNVHGAGSTVPLRFNVGRGLGVDILASNSPFSRRVECDTLQVPSAAPPFVTPRELPVATQSPGNAGLSVNSQGVYHYNWKTEAAWAGTCREVVLTRKDGIQHRAFFRFVQGD